MKSIEGCKYGHIALQYVSGILPTPTQYNLYDISWMDLSWRDGKLSIYFKNNWLYFKYDAWLSLRKVVIIYKRMLWECTNMISTKSIWTERDLLCVAGILSTML